jgi:hypothetical protein
MSEQGTSGKVIRAEQFELVDKAGRVRAALYVNENAEAALAFNDQEGKVRAQLGLGPTGHPSLTLLGEDTQPFIFLGFTESGGVRVALESREGKKRATLELSPSGWPALFLYDTSGEPRAVLQLDETNGEPVLALLGKGPEKKGRYITPQEDHAGSQISTGEK